MKQLLQTHTHTHAQHVERLISGYPVGASSAPSCWLIYMHVPCQSHGLSDARVGDCRSQTNVCTTHNNDDSAN